MCSSDLQARMPTLKFQLGLRRVSKNDTPPRVVWGPDTDEWDGAYNVARLARALRQRRASVKIHCWGSTLLETEQILHLLVAAWHRSVGGPAFTPDTVSWEAPAWADRGECATFTVRTRIPVTDDSLALLEPPITPEPGYPTGTPGDGVLEQGES